MARFPGAEGRIPNFVGAEAAADHLRGTVEWRQSTTLKANPSIHPSCRCASGLPPRRQDGLHGRAAAWRPTSPSSPSIPACSSVAPRRAVSISGANRYGRPVDLTDLRPVDLVVTGCVAASPDGSRLGKEAGSAISNMRWPGKPKADRDVHGDRHHCPPRCRYSRTGAFPSPAMTFGSRRSSRPRVSSAAGTPGPEETSPRSSGARLTEEKIQAGSPCLVGCDPDAGADGTGLTALIGGECRPGAFPHAWRRHGARRECRAPSAMRLGGAAPARRASRSPTADRRCQGGAVPCGW